MTNLNIIEVESLSKTYDGKVKAINNITLQIEQGTICALLGENGAGKTTIIKILMGMLKFDDGEVKIKRQSIKENYPISLKKIIGYVPDTNTLYGYLTGYQYLRFICGLYGIDFKRNLGEVDEYVKLFHMDKYMNKLIHTYSKGTVQKLIILSEFIHKPKIMFMDEPFSALDPEMIAIVLDLIRKKANEGCTFIISSHIIGLVERICDVYTIIKEGQILAQGKTRQIESGKTLEDIYFESANSFIK